MDAVDARGLLLMVDSVEAAVAFVSAAGRIGTDGVDDKLGVTVVDAGAGMGAVVVVAVVGKAVAASVAPLRSHGFGGEGIDKMRDLSAVERPGNAAATK